LILVEQTLGSSDGGQPDRHHPFEDPGNGFEEGDDEERDGGVIAGLARLVQDHPVCSFQ